MVPVSVVSTAPGVIFGSGRIGSSAATAGRASDSARLTARSLCTGNLRFDITEYTDPQPEIESQIRDGTGAMRYSMVRGRRKEIIWRCRPSTIGAPEQDLGE